MGSGGGGELSYIGPSEPNIIQCTKQITFFFILYLPSLNSFTHCNVRWYLIKHPIKILKICHILYLLSLKLGMVQGGTI